jgi:hypothetical protein
MSSYSLEYLKMELYMLRTCESFFKSPLDLEPLQSMIQDQENSGGSGDSGATQSYVDFLLPLPDHLQQTEVGIPDRSMINKRREEGGLNAPLDRHSVDSKKELKARKDLKQQLKAKPPGPAPSRKLKIMPRPGGGTSMMSEEED